MVFEWDEEKNRRNIKKHGISFNTAVLVFGDENRIEYFQYRNGEERYATIGMVGDVIVVVHTMRDDAYRIITARPAVKDEIEEYYGNS
ncbi:MAG: BrnT family toxin [Lachnospiraceae bacterium]|nr:BrnT family toxin [Lachnospiraceae bacterium]